MAGEIHTDSVKWNVGESVGRTPDGALTAIPTSTTDTEQGLYDSPGLSLNNGTHAFVEWRYVNGIELLNLSDSEHPAILDNGTYAITISTETGNLTAGGFYNAELFIERSDFTFIFEAITVAVYPSTETTWSGVFNLLTDDTISLRINNGDGSVGRIFTMINAVLVKFS